MLFVYKKGKINRNELNDFIDRHGGYWEGEHPDFPPDDWQYEVANGDTRCGYWEWAYNQAENDG